MTISTQRLDNIFDMRYGHSLELNGLKHVHSPEGVNFVSRAMGNNGVTARVAYAGNDLGKVGELTVALSGNGVLSTFVQPEEFVTGFHVMILSPKDAAMSTVEKLWWARCIWENRYRFSYGRQANRTLASLEVPATLPDWVHTLKVPTHEGLARAAGASVTLTDPTGTGWADFRLDALFDVKKGKRFTKASRVPGDTPFVGASEKNNGITDYCDLDPLHPAGVMTVVYNGNSVGYAFYQPEPFVASDDVNVLYPKVPMNRWVQLFVASIIKHQRSRFTYGYKWTLARMKRTVIRLPVATGGEPDWDFMERYVQGLQFSAALRPEMTVHELVNADVEKSAS